MSGTGTPGAPRHDPWAALRQPNFQLYTVSRFCSAAAMTLLQATLLWQVFDITDSTLSVALLGLAQFAPTLLMTLIAGAVADSFDRRKVVLCAQFGAFTFAGILTLASLGGDPRVGLIFAAALCIAAVMSFDFPARQALLPSLVRIETFPQAITTASTVQQLGFVSGPAVAGLLIAVEDAWLAYAAYLVLVAGSMIALALLRPRAVEAARRAVTVAAIREGVGFVWKRQVILGSMTLDMFAVIFGGAQALLPVYAKEILDVGSLGYGILLSSLDAGALLMAVVLLVAPPVRRTGLALLLTVAVFGLATIAFGLSRSFPLSVALYAAIGMADQVSVVMRQTTIQLATPDELRGRVSSVNSLFIGASNRLGAVESGLVASVTSATFAVVSGGAACLGVVAAVWLKMPELRAYRIEAAAPLAEAPAAASSAGDVESEADRATVAGGGQAAGGS